MFISSPKTISGTNIFSAIVGDKAEAYFPWVIHHSTGFERWTKMRKILRLHFTKQFTVATKGVGTRSRPNSPLHLGVSDPEQILKTTRKIKRSHSSPALCNPDQTDLVSPFSFAKEEEQDSSWLKSTILVSNFQIFTGP